MNTKKNMNMTSNEKELFLELCAFREANAEKLSELISADAVTPWVLGMLLSNRMAGVALRVLEDTALDRELCEWFISALKRAFFFNEIFNSSYERCINMISESFENNFNNNWKSYALLKGAYLFAAYPKGCRVSNDVDVLILPENVGEAAKVLKEMGFSQGYLRNGNFISATREQIIESKMTRGETVPFIKEVDLPFLKYLEIDLNFSLDYKNSDSGEMRDMLSRTHIDKIGGIYARTLEKKDFILHLCSHLYKEATTMPWIRMKRDMTFYKFCDIYTLFCDLSENMAVDLAKTAKVLGMERELAFCAEAIKSFFPNKGNICQSILNELGETAPTLVIAPRDKKLYRYSEDDILARFFCSDRAKLLKEVKS